MRLRRDLAGTCACAGGAATRGGLGRRGLCALAAVLALALTLLLGAVPFAWAVDDADDAETADDVAVDPYAALPGDTLTYTILEVAVADLASADAYLDGQVVQITGEVVGDRINAEWDSDCYWLTVEARDEMSDAEVEVYVDADMADLVDTYGDYDKIGTVLQIQGTFHLACSEHEGLSDLHADNVEVVLTGGVVEQQVQSWMLLPAVVLVVVGLGLILVFYRLREGQR